MMTTGFIKKIIITLFSVTFSLTISDALSNPKNIYPKALHTGNLVGLISSASYSPNEQDVAFAIQRLQHLGLKVKLGNSVYQHDGYFSGTTQQRANDINSMFVNPRIKAIFEVRGGWGSAELLKYIDYDAIKKHPKIIIGFSDITSLLLAIHKKTGLVTFHGPLAFEPWPQFSVKYLKKTLFAPNKVTYSNPNTPPNLKKDIIQTQHITQTIQPGIATGHLVGGNLSVLVTLLGTPYEPDWNNTILFVEETGENNYRIDRMLSQLNNAGVFSKIKGFVFGECRQCKISSNDLGSFSLYSIIKKYTQPYHIPAYMGASFGHEPENFTLPIGVVAKMDATKGSIQLLHAAVSD